MTVITRLHEVILPMAFTRLNHKSGFVILFLVTTGLLGFGYFLEYYYHLIPCPLCMTQRLCFGVICLLSLSGLLFSNPNKDYPKTYAVLLFTSLLGAFLAGRQIWIQHLPEDRVPACGPDLSYLIQEFPLADVLTAMFAGDGNCAEAVWVFLDLNVAEWSFVWFAIIGIFTILQLVKKKPHYSH